jgi:uronate dehydrogenase
MTHASKTGILACFFRDAPYSLIDWKEQKMKILITGAAGAVGTTLVKGLKDRYSLRGFDTVETPDLEDTIIEDIADFEAILKAAKGMDAIIHLANAPSLPVGERACTAAGEDTLPSKNFVGMFNVLEAARQNGVRRVAYASRAGLLSPYPKTIKRTIDMMTQPQSYYSVSKAFGESLGYMYSSQFGIEFVAVRIGNFNRERPLPEHPHHLGHADAVRVFERAIIHPGVKFEIVFGVSDSTWDLYDLEHGRKVLDYYPQDKSDIAPEV